MDFSDGSTWFLSGLCVTVALVVVLVVTAWVAELVHGRTERRPPSRLAP